MCQRLQRISRRRRRRTVFGARGRRGAPAPAHQGKKDSAIAAVCCRHQHSTEGHASGRASRRSAASVDRGHDGDEASFWAILGSQDKRKTTFAGGHDGLNRACARGFKVGPPMLVLSDSGCSARPVRVVKEGAGAACSQKGCYIVTDVCRISAYCLSSPIVTVPEPSVSSRSKISSTMLATSCSDPPTVSMITFIVSSRSR